MQVSNRVIAIAVAAFIVLLLLLNSFFVVNEREQAIVTRFGQIEAVHEEPGLHFKFPFAFAGVDNVQIIEDRLLRVDLDDIRVQTSGGRFYIVNAFITYEIDDAVRFRQTASGDLQLVENRLRTRFEDAVRGVYGRRGFEAALSEARAEMMREVNARLQPEATRLGLAVEDVRIRRTDLTPEVSEQTFARMRSEREAEAERLRARGNEAAQRIRAIANRQVVEIESDAVRESEIIRGQGEGERNRIFADAFGQDPEFFEFYRSMEAYRRAFEGGQSTRMVLSPDSEFLEFLLNPGTASPVPTSLSLGRDGSGNVVIAPATDGEATDGAATDGAATDGAATDEPSAAVGDGSAGEVGTDGVAPAGDGDLAEDDLAVPGNVAPDEEPGTREAGPGTGDAGDGATVAPSGGVAPTGEQDASIDAPAAGEELVVDEGESTNDAVNNADVIVRTVPIEPTAPIDAAPGDAAPSDAASGDATAADGAPADGATVETVPAQ